jgi:hypothetical protein
VRNRSLRAARVATSARAVASLISPSPRPRGRVYHPKCPRPTWPAAGQQCLAVTGARIVPWISSWRQSIKPPDGLHRSLRPMPTWHLGSRCRCPVSPGLCAMCVRAPRVSVPGVSEIKGRPCLEWASCSFEWASCSFPGLEYAYGGAQVQVGSRPCSSQQAESGRGVQQGLGQQAVALRHLCLYMAHVWTRTRVCWFESI